VTRWVLVGHDREVAEFVAKLAPIARPDWRDFHSAVGVVDNAGRLVAGVVLSNYRPQFSSVEISAAAVSSHAFSIGIVNALGAYVFRQLSINRVEARTATDNERAKRLLRGVGFKPEAVHADWYGPRRHAAVYRLLKADWERRNRAEEARKAA
jgi:ribosomal protein S18 acetylase RimI-like enzyme